MDSKNKIIEVAKCFGIILVIMGHSYGAGLFAMKIYHMPLFFFLSGLTLNVTYDFIAFAKKKIVRLYVPFVIYELTYMLLNPFFFSLGITSQRFQNITDYIVAIIHILLFDNYSILLSPIWFVTAIFFASIIAYVVVKLCMKKSNCTFTIFIIGLAFIYVGLIFGENELLMFNWSFNFVQAFNVILEGTGYMSLGFIAKNTIHLFKEGGYNDIRVKRKVIDSLVLIFFVAMMAFERMTLLTADMRRNAYDFWILQPILALIGIAGIFVISKYCMEFLERNRLINIRNAIFFIGAHTFSLMCLHPIAFKVIGCIQVHLLGMDKLKLADWQLVNDSFIWRGIICISGVLLPIMCVLIIKKIVRKIKCRVRYNTTKL